LRKSRGYFNGIANPIQVLKMWHFYTNSSIL